MFLPLVPHNWRKNLFRYPFFYSPVKTALHDESFLCWNQHQVIPFSITVSYPFSPFFTHIHH